MFCIKLISFTVKHIFMDFLLRENLQKFTVIEFAESFTVCNDLNNEENR